MMPKEFFAFPDPPFFPLQVTRPLGRHLVTGTAGLGDDALELVDLLLGTAEGTELFRICQYNNLGIV
jgi:hypothetical protein